MKPLTLLTLLILFAVGCAQKSEVAKMKLPTFEDEVDFLKEHTAVVLLGAEDAKSRVAVSPSYQGRVMTSTLDGPGGLSFGWINRRFIEAGAADLHFNNVGGEDRFWLGPEAGQYGLFFKKGDPFDLSHWYTPPSFNQGPFEVIRASMDTLTMRKAMRVENYSGTPFDLEVERSVQILPTADVEKYLGASLPAAVKVVAYESDNRITNTGQGAWTKDKGLLSIWILGQFTPSPHTTVIVPFVTGPESELGPIVNDRYFGKIPADRLAVKDGYLLFKADGRYRSKLGVSRSRCKPVLGSFNADTNVLTIVQYTLPEATDYVNSMWEMQAEPYRGDVINSYNGPTDLDKPELGGFYELETSSPAAALKPNESLSHTHRTFHFQGDLRALDAISRSVLGVSLSDVKGAL